MPLRILVVDDTVTYRKIFSDVLKEMPDIECVGTAPSGSIALKKMAHEVIHLVFLDVYMPEMNGVETLKLIKKEFPDIAVVMMSAVSTQNADSTIEALSIGALDFIRKPDGTDVAANITQLKRDIHAVLQHVRQKQLLSKAVTLLAKPGPKSSVPADIKALQPRIIYAPVPKTFGVCVIGVSTGGPEALSKLVPAFSGPLSVPIFCIQHMPPLFTKSLADSLAKKSKLTVVEATDNEPVLPGVMYIAPGGRHMVVRKKDTQVVIGLNDEPLENSCRPSVDVLFRSIAAIYGDIGILAVVLTGMGNDGCNGVRSLKRKGCYCITQSKQSCVVYGMPRAVDEAGLSDKSLPLESIPVEIETLLKSGKI
jgi:two-component system, chemotaxis family, protein-glutamate methylesterase/glutaminase